MSKFLNSEQAKAEEEQEKTLEELQAENEQLKTQVAGLEKRMRTFGDLLAQYALQKAELELQIKELTAR